MSLRTLRSLTAKFRLFTARPQQTMYGNDLMDGTIVAAALFISNLESSLVDFDPKHFIIKLYCFAKENNAHST